MKVLHLIDHLWLGGAQSLLKAVLESGKTQDHSLFALRHKDFSLKISHPELEEFPGRFKYSLHPLNRIRKKVREENIKVLHCHLPRSIFFGCILKRFYLKDIKLVVHEHGLIFHGGILALIYRIFRKNIDQIIACSEAVKAQLLDKTELDGSIVSVVPNFIDPEPFYPENFTKKKEDIRVEYGVPQDDFVYGCAGRLYKRKGWKEFVDAAILLAEKRNFHFVIAGLGPDKKKMLRRIKKSGLSTSFSYIGLVKEMSKYYQMLDAFVLPSHWEGMPLAQLETFAACVPLVSTSGPGLAEIVVRNENAFVCRPKDHYNLSVEMLRVYEDKQKARKYIEAGRARLADFNLEAFLEGLNSVYSCLRPGIESSAIEETS